jgi:NOL1/NOP2/fmu family ribosome biogenesis protein
VDDAKEYVFKSVGDMIYGYNRAVVDDVVALSESLSVVYSGVAMGQIFKGKLKPEHPLALFVGVNSGAVPSAELDEATALSYLRRQDISAAPFAEGINIVRYRGVAIGFVKRIGARCNNMYPKEQRIIKN